MRRFRHWTWRYANDRARLLAYELTHRGWPWLTPEANAFLHRALNPGTACFEWGSGKSTVWIAKRGARIVSVEHDPKWYARVTNNLRKQNLNEAELILVDAHSPQYVFPIHAFADKSLDAVIVDGISELRDVCANAALPKLRPGGFILIDDAHRYFPAQTQSPNALSKSASPPTKQWEEFVEHTAAWTCHRFTSGVTDTAIWVRPDTRN